MNCGEIYNLCNRNMKDGLSIVGSSRSNGEREENDFYPTPPEATISLMEREKFSGLVWECACGDGSMSKVIAEYNPVKSTDLVDRGYGNSGIDFLEQIDEVDNIITNPPYKLAKEFVLHAKRTATKKIAMLCKLVFLESSGRYDMWQDTKFPLKTVYVFCKRVPIYKSGITMKNSGLIAYAWFVWDKNYVGKPQIEWIK